MRSDRSRLFGLWFLSIPVLLLGCVVVAGVGVSYPVGIVGRVEEVPVSVTLRRDGWARVVDVGGSFEVPPGGVLSVQSGSVEVIFGGGRGPTVGLVGPAEWGYQGGERLGTAFEHLFGFSHDYAIIFEQNSGTVHYDFGHTKPPFREWEIVLRLPDGNHKPPTPCWQVSIDGENIEVKPSECARHR